MLELQHFTFVQPFMIHLHYLMTRSPFKWEQQALLAPVRKRWHQDLEKFATPP